VLAVPLGSSSERLLYTTAGIQNVSLAEKRHHFACSFEVFDDALFEDMLKVASNIFSPQTCADISHEL
jgi:hypothetical protein